MAKMLINGRLQEKPISTDGVFHRQVSSFRNWISEDGNTGFKAQPHRYVLFISKACPWCHRTTLMHTLMGLEDLVPVVNLKAMMTAQGWEIEQGELAQHPGLEKMNHLYELYLLADAHYTGNITAPVLWDNHTQTIVSNESADIMRMFHSQFNALRHKPAAVAPLNLYPIHLQENMNTLNEFIYSHISNGIYKTGFATCQQAYEEALNNLFDALDIIEERLQGQDYLLGATLTEADLRLFPSLIRFDAVYFIHFKASKKRISDYPNLNRYLHTLFSLPWVAKTVDMVHIKQHYFLSHQQLNPSGIIPHTPEMFASLS